jgi:hypothetical protein
MFILIHLSINYPPLSYSRCRRNWGGLHIMKRKKGQVVGLSFSVARQDIAWAEQCPMGNSDSASAEPDGVTRITDYRLEEL